jgi:oligosaccharide repeat unit polymerase
LFAGNKGPVVMALLAFGWVWHRTIRPLRSVLLVAAAIVLAVLIIPLTTAIREEAGRDRTSFEAIQNAYSGITNPAIAFLSETGWTATTVAHTIELVPAVREYDHGQSYAYAVMAMVPNVGGGLHPSKEHGFLADWLVSSLAPEYAARGGGWGFSFIGEAYANFGLYGMSLALVGIGYLFGSLFAWEQTSADPARTAMIGACLCNCLLYARGESGLLLREIVWYALIPYLCVDLLTRRRIRLQAESRREIPLPATLPVSART